MRNAKKWLIIAGVAVALALLVMSAYELWVSLEDFWAWSAGIRHLSKVRGSDRDLFCLADTLAASGKPLPRVYLACGKDDPLLPGSRRLRDCFERNGFPVTYEEGPGAHEWDFWNRHLQRVIEWLEI